MKIRNGFVSNSSSSSFMIYGTSFSDAEKGREALKKVIGDKPLLNWKNEPVDIATLSKSNIVDYLADELGMEYHCPYGYEYYIGSSWDSMGENETKAQFKDRVANELKRAFGDDVKPETYEESWYDG